MKVLTLVAFNLAMWSGMVQMVTKASAHLTDGDRKQLTQLVKFVTKKHATRR